MGAWTEMWTAFDKLFDQKPRSFEDAFDEMLRRDRETSRTFVGKVAAHGCICPPGAEATCKGALCPRRPIGPAS